MYVLIATVQVSAQIHIIRNLTEIIIQMKYAELWIWKHPVPHVSGIASV